ncbi:MAG: hypothetical protein KAW12_24855 [Candidatus Aminicenantes bacterium]|nr:hypothetical protein [Candidatus Aminicenantes bacterium]
MGTININVPGDIKLEYKIENVEIIEKVLRVLKDAVKKNKIERKQDGIVGIWKDRYDENITSGMIQRMFHI